MAALEKILIHKNTNTKIAFISSFSVYSVTEEYLSENSKTYNTSDYAKSKLEMEKSLKNFAEVKNFNLIILRMPVLLYKGVQTNFLGQLKKSIKNNTVAKLSNPSSGLSLVFDVKNIVEIMNSEWHGFNLINCSADPDISFLEISNLAKKYGLSKLEWIETNRPSQNVNTSRLISILGRLPSGNEIVKNWFLEEFSK